MGPVNYRLAKTRKKTKLPLFLLVLVIAGVLWRVPLPSNLAVAVSDVVAVSDSDSWNLRLPMLFYTWALRTGLPLGSLLGRQASTGGREAISAPGQPTWQAARELLAFQFAWSAALDREQQPVVLPLNTPEVAPSLGEDEERDEGSAILDEWDLPLLPQVGFGKVVHSSSQIGVGIYNTHNAESYLPSDGQEKLEGKNGGIARVAQVLTDSLEEQGITVTLSRTIHDYPDFEKSYLNSQQTAQKMLSSNPTLAALVDVHRDAGIKKKEVVQVKGKPTARVLFIVGSDKRLTHPGWRQNREFAARVAARLEEMYPGVVKGVRVQDGRYNQNLHPRALLVEVGSTVNTREEAENAVRLVGEALASLLKELPPLPAL